MKKIMIVAFVMSLAACAEVPVTQSDAQVRLDRCERMGEPMQSACFRHEKTDKVAQMQKED